YVRSILKDRKSAPRQGSEGAPNAQLEIDPEFAESVDGLEAGQDIWIFTWFHQAERATQRVHPRGDPANREMGVFATRSPDRPNPIGLHRSKVLRIVGCDLEVQGLEAIDGTPVVDIK